MAPKRRSGTAKSVPKAESVDVPGDIMTETMRDLRAQNQALIGEYREARSLIIDFQDRLRDRSRSPRQAR